MADPTPKNLGDYAVELEKAMASNNTSGVPLIVEEMRAAAPPLPPPPAPGDPPVAPPPAPPPVDRGLRGFADALDAAAQANNVVTARQLCEDMKTLEPPTPPPAEPPPPTP